MKKFRKPISFVLAIMLLISIIPMQVFGAAGTTEDPLQFYVGFAGNSKPTNIQAGDIITIEVDLGKLDPGTVGAYGVNLTFDTNSLEYSDATQGDMMGVQGVSEIGRESSDVVKTGGFLFGGSGFDFSADRTTILSVTFNVKQDVVAGTDITPVITVDSLSSPSLDEYSYQINYSDIMTIAYDEVETPVIQSSSSSPVNYENDSATATPLSVVAQTPTSATATVSYQWYSKADGAADFVLINGASSADYTPVLTGNGTTTYYCLVAMNDSNAIDATEKTVASKNFIVNVGKIEPTIINPTVSSPLTRTYDENQTLSDILADDAAFDVEFRAENVGEAITGTFSWENPDEVLTVAKTNYAAIFTPDDGATYSTAYFDVVINVSPQRIVAGVSILSDVVNYTGESIEPSVRVTNQTDASNPVVLTLDEDYTVEYTNNINVGDKSKVIVKPKTGGNYTFADYNLPFTINAVEYKVVLNKDLNKTYDGSAIVPGEKIKVIDLNDMELEVDATFAFYANQNDADNGENALAEAPTFAGTYYYKVTTNAVGNYAATDAVFPVTINQADYTVVVPTTGSAVINDEMPIEDIGHAFTGVTLANGTQETGVGILTWYIDEGRTIKTDGSSFDNQLTVTLYWKYVPTNSDYIQTPKTGETIYTLSKTPQSLVWDNNGGGDINARYGDTAVYTHTASSNLGPASVITYSSSAPDIVSVNSDSGAISIKDVGTAVITATADETNEYSRAEISYSVIVAPKTINATIDTPTPIKYGDEIPSFDFTIENGALVGMDTKDDVSVSITTTAAKGSDVGDYIVIASDNDSTDKYIVNFTNSGNVNLTIEKIDHPTPTIIEKTIEVVYTDTSLHEVDVKDLYPEITSLANGSHSDVNGIIDSSMIDGNLYKYSIQISDALTKDNIGDTAVLEILLGSKNYNDITAKITVKIVDKKIQTATYSKYNVEVVEGADAFTNPLTNLLGNANVTYSSSNEKVAMVDSTGKVSILAAGNATITANIEATSIYESAQATYMVKVTPKTADTPDLIKAIKIILDLIFDEVNKFFFGGVQLTLTADGEDKLIITDYPGFEGEVGTIERGSAIVTLNEEFVKFLPEGRSFDVELQNTAGETLAVSSVATPTAVPVDPTDPADPADPADPTTPETDVPSTGDTSNPMLLIGLVVVSVIGLAALAVVLVKRKKATNK